jgi:hypothetical protein
MLTPAREKELIILRKVDEATCGQMQYIVVREPTDVLL